MCAHTHTQARRLLISSNGVCIAHLYAYALQDQFLLALHAAHAGRPLLTNGFTRRRAYLNTITAAGVEVLRPGQRAASPLWRFTQVFSSSVSPFRDRKKRINVSRF